MKIEGKLPRSLLLIGAMLLVNACGSDSVTVEPEQLEAPDLGPLGGLNSVVSVADYSLANSGSAAISELITYRMPSVGGGVTQATAAVLVPPGPAPEGGFPLIGWGHQSTGVADRCAPSVTDDLAGRAAYLNTFLENGFAVVAPDYEGLGVDGVHPYLHLASAGRSIVYAIDAAVQQYPDLSSRYAVVGHSQGGHAALGAGEHSNEVADVELVGIVAIAPASNFRQQHQILGSAIRDTSRSLADRARAATTQLLFSAFVASGIDAVEPALDVDTFFGLDGADLLNGVDTECVAGIREIAVASVVGPLAFDGNVDSVIANSIVDIPEVAQFLADNEPGTTTIPVPVLLLQGLLDSVVFPESTSMLDNLLRNINNTESSLIQYPSADHSSVVDVSEAEVLNFLFQVLVNQP